MFESIQQSNKGLLKRTFVLPRCEENFIELILSSLGSCADGFDSISEAKARSLRSRASVISNGCQSFSEIRAVEPEILAIVQAAEKLQKSIGEKGRVHVVIENEIADSHAMTPGAPSASTNVSIVPVFSPSLADALLQESLCGNHANNFPSPIRRRCT